MQRYHVSKNDISQNDYNYKHVVILLPAPCVNQLEVHTESISEKKGNICAIKTIDNCQCNKPS